MSGSLDGQVAVITGGGTGIGLATAARFVAEGASVVIAGRRQAELDKAVAAVGGDIIAVRADVSRLDDLDRLYARVAEEKGRVDTLFANAAVVEPEALGDLTEEAVDRILSINVKGLIFTVQKALPLFTDGGSIILNASVDASKGGPGRSVYAATKAATRNLARSWLEELSGRKIRVNVVSPGSTETPGLADLAGDGDVDRLFAVLAARIPLGRNARAEEVAAAVAFLASKDAGFINGVDLRIDGGFAQI
ncbi:SDR family NAD(P)-dependent oxidoreductase [Streptosporangium subroseum]|uniref:SDR family NAD(P)-dependent oxidoreductase n=1 Tax=Streptosporangium subroseum TaxID=106412 RepID=UPI00308FB1B0|nr:SDR family oxidoreductase [Streptosporangium subroseum]